jgi:hypothetical protein
VAGHGIQLTTAVAVSSCRVMATPLRPPGVIATEPPRIRRPSRVTSLMREGSDLISQFQNAELAREVLGS